MIGEKAARHWVVVLVLGGVLCNLVAAGTVTFQYGLNGYQATEDTTLAKNKPEDNYGGSGAVTVQDADYKQTLIKFEDIFGEVAPDPCDPNGLSQVPTFQDGYVIRKATVRLYYYNDLITNGNMPKQLVAYPMLVGCNFGTHDGAAHVGEVDYAMRGQTTEDWGPPTRQGPQGGVDYDAAWESKSEIYYYGALNSFLEVDVTAIVQAWHVGMLVNHGLLIRGGTDQTASYFRSADYTTASERPKLVVEFGAPTCGDLLYDAPAGDLTADCYVNLEDLAALAGEWDKCTFPDAPGCDELASVASDNIIEGSVNVDGDLTEWASADWILLDQIYDGDVSDVTSAQFAARWSDAENKLYVAAKVDDSDHVFQDTCGSSDASDRLEVYFSINGGDYQTFQENAQQYVIGHGPGNDWAVLGNGIAMGDPMGFEYSISVAGSEIQYEVGLTPFSFYGGLFDPAEPNEVADLASGMTILFDVIAGTRHRDGYGMLAENTDGGKYYNTNAFAQYVLGAAECGMWGHYPADLDEDCYVGLADLSVMAGAWLDCTDPCLPCGFVAEPLVSTVRFRNGVDGYAGCEDAMLNRQSGFTEYNYGASDNMTLQGEIPSPYKSGLMKFDISSLPAGRTIQSATLRIKLNNDIISGSTTPRRVRAYPMLVGVNYGNKDGSAAGVGEVDMHQRAQAQADWGLPIPQDKGPQPGDPVGTQADYDSTISSAATYYRADIGSFLEIDITDILRNWYDGSVTNHGLALFGDSSQTAGYFSTADDPDVEDRPELVVVYRRDLD